MSVNGRLGVINQKKKNFIWIHFNVEEGNVQCWWDGKKKANVWKKFYFSFSAYFILLLATTVKRQHWLFLTTQHNHTVNVVEI